MVKASDPVTMIKKSGVRFPVVTICRTLGKLLTLLCLYVIDRVPCMNEEIKSKFLRIKIQ